MPFSNDNQQDRVFTNLEHRWNAVRNNDLINLAMHVIPELLQDTSLKKSFLEILAMLVGISMMILIAVFE